MTPTALALALTTTTSAFLPIAGQPTDNDLVRIKDALAPILLNVTYDCANGVQNLWGLIADAGRYQSKTIMEHKHVTYDGQLRPIIVKSNIVPNAQVR